MLVTSLKCSLVHFFPDHIRAPLQFRARGTFASLRAAQRRLASVVVYLGDPETQAETRSHNL